MTLLAILSLFFNISSTNKSIKFTKVKVSNYKGVSPPSPKIPKILPKPGKSCLLVWPGFQSKKKTKFSRFFFMFTSKINLKYSKISIKNINYLRLLIPSCSAWKKNAWRDIITHFFMTPVEKVSFYRSTKKNDMIIDIEYKDKIIMPRISKINFLGYYLLLLEYPYKKK